MCLKISLMSIVIIMVPNLYYHDYIESYIETIYLRNALICFTLPVNCLILMMHHFLDNGYSCLGSLFRGFNKGKRGFIFRKLLSVIGLVRLSILETPPS